MNRHDRRRLDAMHRSFLGELPQEPEEVRNIKREFFGWLEDLKKKGEKPLIAYGAMSEREGANAFVKKIEKTEKGTEQEFWGCSYKLKLPRQGMKLHAFDLAKSMMSEVPIKLLGWRTIFFLNRKKIDYLLTMIVNRNIRWIWIDPSEWSQSVREIWRVGKGILKERGFSEFELGPHPDKSFPQSDGSILHIFAALLVFYCYFLEVDTAYRFRVQDAFDGTLKGTLNTLLARDVAHQGKKWGFLRRFLPIILWFLGGLKPLLDEFLTRINKEQIRMDGDDWYFALGYTSYEFGGISANDRWAERQRIDKEKGHLLFFA